MKFNRLFIVTKKVDNKTLEMQRNKVCIYLVIIVNILFAENINHCGYALAILTSVSAIGYRICRIQAHLQNKLLSESKTSLKL